MFKKKCEHKERHANKKLNIVHKDMQAKNPTLYRKVFKQKIQHCATMRTLKTQKLQSIA
jgi:hypothetical protein